MRIPAFKPTLQERNGDLIYEDGRVRGVLTSHQEGVASIHEWSSHYPGHGFSSDALFWLRMQGFETLSVNGIGELEEGIAPEGSAAYWLHQYEKGLVDELMDDNGFNVTPSRTEEDDEDELDEFTLALGLRETGKALESLQEAMKATVKESHAARAQRKLSVHAVMTAFAKGQLHIEPELLEDSDVLYDLMGSDPVRHATIVKQIFALNQNASLELASVLLRRYPQLGAIKTYEGEPTLAYVKNSQGTILGANGVLTLGSAVRKDGYDVLDADAAQAVIVPVSKEREKELLNQFSWITQLIAEMNNLSLGLSQTPQP
jgi:hypothetical protein